MKGLKITLCVLALVLALIIAGSSYFLYAKRETMLEGWTKLGNAVHATAAALDKNSGTTLSEELTGNSLSHANYAKLGEMLPKISTAAETVVGQRDNLAIAMREIAVDQEMSNVPAAKDYMDLVTSKGSADATVANAKAFKRNRDRVYSNVDTLAQTAGSSVDVAKLRSGDVSGLNDFKETLQLKLTQNQDYQDGLRDISRTAGEPVNDFSQREYRNSIVKVRNAVTSLNGKLDAANQKIQQQDSAIGDLNTQVKDQNKRIAAQDATIQNREVRIQQLNKIIGIAPNSDVALWAAGGPEARKDVRGKVTEVNKEFGFFVVDFGKNTRARQVIGTKVNYVDPLLTKDLGVVVVRNADTEGKVEYIRRGKLSEVMEDCCVVDPAEPGADVKVGDVVYLEPFTK